jgi:8-oxo-dGTP pyrophosphatase MutT (NUDIX family)
MAEDRGASEAPVIGAEAPPGGTKRRRRRRRAAEPATSKAEVSKTEPTSGAQTEAAPSRSKGSRRRRRSGRSASAAKRTAKRKDPKSAAPGSKRKRKRKPVSAQPGAGPTKREVSAGGVVYRRENGGIEVVLASRRTRRGDLAWGLAKGGIEDGESMEDAAVREVREETGIRAEIETSLGETRYFYVWEDVRIRKTVHFFLMRSIGGDPDDRDDEMEEVRWFPLERALKRAAYRGERDVLQRAAELLR